MPETTDHTTPDPTHGRVDRDIQAAVDDWGPKSLGQRVAVENTLQAQRDAGREPLAPPAEPAALTVGCVQTVDTDMQAFAELLDCPHCDGCGKQVPPDWGDRREAARREVAEALASPAQPARERPADADAHPGTGGGSSVVLGRALLDDEGTLWWWSDEDDCYRSGDLYLNDPANIGLVREVLLVPPEAGRVLDAARRLSDRSFRRLHPEQLDPLEYDLIAAVDALGDPQQPLQVAAAPPTHGAGWWGVEPAEPSDRCTALTRHTDINGDDMVPCDNPLPCPWHLPEPAPEPDSDIDKLADMVNNSPKTWEHISDRFPGLAHQIERVIDPDLRAAPAPEPAGGGPDWQRLAMDAQRGYDAARAELAEVTADRDRLSGEVAAHEGELGDMRAQLSATEADLDGVVLQRDRLLAERATAHRDAAADALTEGAARIRRIWTDSVDPEQCARYFDALASATRNGTRPVPGSPEPAGDRPTTTDTEE